MRRTSRCDEIIAIIDRCLAEHDLGSQRAPSERRWDQPQPLLCPS